MNTNVTKLNGTNNYIKTRTAISIISGCLFVAVFIWLIIRYWNIYFGDSSAILGSMNRNELTEKAIEIKLSISQAFFQLAIIFLGALWGLVLAKKGEAKLVVKDRQELMTFIFSNCLLFSSLLAHHLYQFSIANSYFLAGVLLDPEEQEQIMPNVLGTSINSLLNCQLWSLVAGIVLAVFTLLSVHWFRSSE